MSAQGRMVCCCLMLVCLSCRGPSEGQEPGTPEVFRVWTDATGAFSVEAKLVSVTEKGVRLEKRSKALVDVPLERLSAADRQYVQRRSLQLNPPDAAAPRPSPESAASEAPVKSSLFQFTPWMERNAVELQALGYLKSETQRKDALVAPRHTVTHIPATYIEAHCQHTMHYLAAMGYPTVKRKALPKDVLALTEHWLTPLFIFTDEGEEKRKQRPMLDLIRGDARLHTELAKHFGTGEPTNPGLPADQLLPALTGTMRLSARELLPVNTGAGIKIPQPISVLRLITRFEPQVAIAEQDPDSVAEELVWSKRLGIGDGTYPSLPRSRMLVQAALLENLHFDIGNPADSDAAQAAAAKDKLAAAKQKVFETWRDAAKGE